MTSPPRKVRFVCISDTHNHGPGEGFTLPKGDVLVHAGDLTNQGSYHELKKVTEWIAKADFAVKIIVAGNHDLSLDPKYSLQDENGWKVMPEDTEKCRELVKSVEGLVYLQHEAATIKLPGNDISFRVFGSPYSPHRGRENWAFQYSDDEASALWDAIPSETDILITHTPATGHCDTSKHWLEGGCSALGAALRRVKPLLHVCGHCHEGRGAEVVRWGSGAGDGDRVCQWEDPTVGTKKQALFDLTGSRGGCPLDGGKETAIVNASVMARSWGRGSKASNKPIVVDVLF